MDKKYNVCEIFEELKKSLVELKMENGKFVQLFGPVRFPLSIEANSKQNFNWYVWNETKKHLDFTELLDFLKDNGANKNYNSFLTYGDFANSDNPLVRVHSCCFTGDIMYSTRCDCGQQIKKSIELIVNNGSGAIAYLSNHEGRGIGLYAKAITHQIQDKFKLDTFESCNVINFEGERRTFEDLGIIINYLRDCKGITLLSNNPEKINGLVKDGVKITAIQPLDGFENEDNINVLNQKKRRAEKIQIELPTYNQ